MDTAMKELRKAFRTDVADEAVKTASALAARVDQARLLPGYSSCIAAAACYEIASEVLQTEPLLTRDVTYALDVEKQAVRSAKNQLWVHRDKLHDVVTKYGGDPDCLGLPRLANGKIEQNARWKHVDAISDDYTSPYEPRKESVVKRSSQLKTVTYPHASTTEAGTVSINEGPGADQMHSDSNLCDS